MVFSANELKELASSATWFHSLDLGNGVITEGMKSRSQLEHELHALRLPDLRGKSVLDIGAWDGYFSFTAERLGARRVLALDHYMWSLDVPAVMKHWRECKERGLVPRPYHETRYWQPLELPGKRGFDIAHKALGSNVEDRVDDYMEMDLSQIGTFDVVLYLGVLYHMESPLEALKRVASVTGEVAIIETEAVAFPRHEHQAVCEFFPTNELNGDVSNWWAPNEKALEGLCLAAGFQRLDILGNPPPEVNAPPEAMPTKIPPRSGFPWLRKGKRPSSPSSTDVIRYRAIAHAWK